MERNDKQILAEIGRMRLAVVGDSMVDRFLWGTVDRISPEAPVPVVSIQKETVKLGGAANVAANIRALGAQAVLCGVVGQDEVAGRLAGLLTEVGIDPATMTPCADRPTTVKTRIIAHSQQVVRTDHEVVLPVSETVAAAILASLDEAGPVDGIVLSDYGKGALTQAVLDGVIERGLRWRIPVVVDPKQGDFCQYKGATSLTPNQKEAEQACTLTVTDEASLRLAGRTLLERTDASAVLITRGENGMALFETGDIEHHLPTQATRVYDVTGAGDTVIAVYTAALAAGAEFLAAASLANHAAGLAVREIGTAAVSAADLLAALEAGGSA